MSLRILSIPWSQGIAAPAPAASIPPWIPDFFVAPTTASPPGGTGAGTIGDPWSWTYATGTGAGTAQGDGKLPTTGAKVGVRGGTYTEKGITVTMRDGVRISLCVYRPDAPGRFPALFKRRIRPVILEGPPGGAGSA